MDFTMLDIACECVQGVTSDAESDGSGKKVNESEFPMFVSDEKEIHD